MKSDRDRQDERPRNEGEGPAETPGTPQGQAGDQNPEATSALEVPLSTALDNLHKERDDLFSRLQRISADYLNYQRRAQRDVQEARSRGVVDLAKAVISVVDDLERAIEHARANHPSDDPLLQGTEMVLANALAKLREFGVQPVATEGQPFDPQTQEALMHQPTDQAEPMTVLKEVQKGYEFNGKTIRPAKVIVAAEPPSGLSGKKPVEDEPAE